MFRSCFGRRAYLWRDNPLVWPLEQGRVCRHGSRCVILARDIEGEIDERLAPSFEKGRESAINPLLIKADSRLNLNKLTYATQSAFSRSPIHRSISHSPLDNFRYSTIFRNPLIHLVPVHTAGNSSKRDVRVSPKSLCDRNKRVNHTGGHNLWVTVWNQNPFFLRTAR